MNSNYILQTDVLDLLFEHRNKAYGAYVLRKFYPDRLFWSLGFTGFVVIILSAITFLPVSPQETLFVDETTFGLPPAPQAEEPIKPKHQKLPITKKIAADKRSGVPLVVKDPVTDTIADQVPAESLSPVSTQNGDLGDPGLLSPGGYETTSFTPQTPAPVKETNVNNPTRSPEVMPEFPGGIPALRKFLERNLRNPRDLADGECISVKMQFIVGVDGKLKTFELVEDGGAEFNNEVVRVLKKMPAWIPGKSNGHNVSVYYTIPVKFIPED